MCVAVRWSASFAYRLMVLRGSWSVKGEPAWDESYAEPSLRDGLRPPMTGQLPRQAWPGVELGLEGVCDQSGHGETRHGNMLMIMVLGAALCRSVVHRCCADGTCIESVEGV